VSFIRLEDNSLVAPFNEEGKPNCYLPSVFKSTVPTVKKCFVENKESIEFLKWIGLKEYDIIEEVKNNVIPKYSDPNISISNEEIYEDNRKINKSLKEAKSDDRRLLILNLKSKNFIRAKSKINDDYLYYKPYEVYLSRKFTGKSGIEEFFKEIGVYDDVLFIDEGFIDIYKDSSILVDLGCKYEINKEDEIQNRILTKYKNEDVEVTDEENLNDSNYSPIR
jgi:hypothetical protein